MYCPSCTLCQQNFVFFRVFKLRAVRTLCQTHSLHEFFANFPKQNATHTQPTWWYGTCDVASVYAEHELRDDTMACLRNTERSACGQVERIFRRDVFGWCWWWYFYEFFEHEKSNVKQTPRGAREPPNNSIIFIMCLSCVCLCVIVVFMEARRKNSHNTSKLATFGWTNWVNNPVDRYVLVSALPQNIHKHDILVNNNTNVFIVDVVRRCCPSNWHHMRPTNIGTRVTKSSFIVSSSRQNASVGLDPTNPVFGSHMHGTHTNTHTQTQTNTRIPRLCCDAPRHWWRR